MYEEPAEFCGGISGVAENGNDTEVAHRDPKGQNESQRVQNRIAAVLVLDAARRRGQSSVLSLRSEIGFDRSDARQQIK